MSRNSKKSPGRLSSRGGSHHQDSNLENNLENKSLQKILKDVNFKAQEQATPEMYNHEKQQHTKDNCRAPGAWTETRRPLVMKPQKPDKGARGDPPAGELDRTFN